MHGRDSEGAYSIVLAGGYEDDTVSFHLFFELTGGPINELLSFRPFVKNAGDMPKNRFSFFEILSLLFLIFITNMQITPKM